jgi:hypothetical protein
VLADLSDAKQFLVTQFTSAMKFATQETSDGFVAHSSVPSAELMSAELGAFPRKTFSLEDLLYVARRRGA